MRVEVQNYKEVWAYMYEEEARRIKEIYGEDLIDIHHIGSTSVPGLKAKPIIDIMPVVKDIGRVDGFNEEMEELGYEALGEYGMEGRRYFRKGPLTRTHHVHIFEENNQMDIIRHLAVKEYLRMHKEAAREYGELKAGLAREFPDDVEGYVEGKEVFVKALQQKAVAWYEKNGDLRYGH